MDKTFKIKIKIKLERKCKVCYNGQVDGPLGANIDCVYCDGTGKVLTKLGKQLCEFLREHSCNL